MNPWSWSRCSLWLPPHPATAVAAAIASTGSHRASVQALDCRDAAIVVFEDELHESLARREPALARAAAEPEALLAHRRANHESGVLAGGHSDCAEAEHLRVTDNPEGAPIGAVLVEIP